MLGGLKQFERAKTSSEAARSLGEPGVRARDPRGFAARFYQTKKPNRQAAQAIQGKERNLLDSKATIKFHFKGEG